MKFYITGDFHGRFEELYGRLERIQEPDAAIIVLGDSGFNYYLNKTDKKLKQKVSEYGFKIYCVRGNHEARPEDVPGMKVVYDSDVRGNVYMEEDFPLIRYLIDGGIYDIENHRTLVIGGAYSVDKDYRLLRGWKWFYNEQLNKEERTEIFERVKGDWFDLILTHTAPLSLEPIDLFLPMIDQSQVDKTTENFLEGIKNNVRWDVWCFGHYHASRIVDTGVEMFFTNIERLRTIMNRWQKESQLIFI